jgi:hypothetical protein
VYWLDFVAFSEEISNNLLKDYEKFFDFFENKKTAKSNFSRFWF